MRKVEKIVAIVDEDTPGLLDCISCEDGLSKEGLVRKVLGISRGQMVRTHQNLRRRTAKASRHENTPADSKFQKGDEKND